MWLNLVIYFIKQTVCKQFLCHLFQINATGDYTLSMDPNSNLFDDGNCLDNIEIVGDIPSL